MNIVLLMLVVLQACIAVCAWLSPGWLRAAAARLLTRADLIDILREEKQRRLQFWNAELGVADYSHEQPKPITHTATAERQRAA